MSDLVQALRRTKGGSDRSFGLVFAALFAIVGFIPLLRGESPRLWPMIVASILLGVSMLWPRGLKPLHRLWMRLGAVLQKIMTPIIMALLYFGVLSPIALIARLAGRDALHLKWEPRAETYWVRREPPGPDGASMKNQF